MPVTSAGSSKEDVLPGAKPRRTNPWVKYGIPAVVAVAVILAAVLGGVLGSRAHNKSTTEAAVASASSSSAAAAESSARSAKAALGRFATATDSEFMVPLYPSTTNAAFSTPTFLSTSSSSNLSWPSDPFTPSSPNPTSVRSDRPRLIAPQYKWNALPAFVVSDPYLQGWNDTIFHNASVYDPLEPVQYHMDGSSGILDNSREIKERIKAFAYVYRMTNNSHWIDRAWTEVSNAFSSNFGPATDKWNSAHFLDVAEMASAMAIAYDWLYDAWTADQRSQILNAINTFGLNFGVAAYNDPTVSYGWWRTNTTGNWNCVCNAGLTLAALAILGDDQTGNAQTLLGLTIDNAKSNCAQAVWSDGTWAETANYWYFGTTGHAEMSSALITATGSDYGLLNTNPANPNLSKTGDYHMGVFGTTSLFNYGDHGPNKFSSTANAMFLYAGAFGKPEYALFQREQWDAAEPWSMFWYEPQVAGAFWDGRALDMNFDNEMSQWVSMRSSWTNQHALFVAMKAGWNQDHQTHNDLDVGDFVLDALGTRWAGELGSGDYNSPGYFNSQAQDSQRWLYYRKMTEGQNTICVNQSNQLVTAEPKVLGYGSSGTKQGASTVLNVTEDDTAFWVADISSAYPTNTATSVKRGVRLLNGRRQVLIQDEVTTSTSWQWRMHTNATVIISQSSTTSATLTLDGQTLKMDILSPGSGAGFSTTQAVRFASDPTPPEPDQENPGVTVVVIQVQEGTTTLEVLFSPQWGDGGKELGGGDVKSVTLDQWSLTSHN